MIERYLLVASRIRQELGDLERLVARAERALSSAKRRSRDQDLFLDSAALNLHDFYTGLERILHYVAANIEGHVPQGREWHRELLRQMGVAVPGIRPQVLSADLVKALDEYLRFRHVLRNIYAFELDTARVERLVKGLRPVFDQVKAELLQFAQVLEQTGKQPG
ncbi:MAG: hypothetical protein ACPLPT_01490 [Moorellales bacterium]